MFPFGKILWVKSVSLDEDTFAYGRQDPTVKAREPKGNGDLFELHSTPDDAESLGDPLVGDLIVLLQHRQATHLVEVVGESPQPRPKKTMRKGSRDSRYSVQRTCRCVALQLFDEAPFVEEAFGFDPRAEGGEVFLIKELPSFEKSKQPLWAVQRRIHQALLGRQSLKAQFLNRRKTLRYGY